MAPRRVLLLVGLLVAWLLLLFFGGSVAQALRSFLGGEPTNFFENYTELTQEEEGVALVYSRYPFNFKDEVFINKGAESGVRQGFSVTTQDEFYVGEVTEVLQRASRVRTVFDHDFDIAVRIGEEQVDAVLEGGPNPRLTLISGKVSQGDKAFIVASRAPYGQPVGTVGEVDFSEDKLFREAELRVPFNPAELRKVNILSSPITP